MGAVMQADSLAGPWTELGNPAADPGGETSQTDGGETDLPDKLALATSSG